MRVMEDARRCMDHRVKLRLENIEELQQNEDGGQFSIGEMDSQTFSDIIRREQDRQMEKVRQLNRQREEDRAK